MAMASPDFPSRTATAGLTWRRLAAALLRKDAVTAAAWDRLNAARCNLPFLSAYAMVAALDAFGDGREELFVASRNAVPVAMFLLVRQGRLSWQTFQPSQIPLGSWVAEPALDLDGLVDGLLHGPLGLALTLTVTQVDPLMAPRAADAPWCEHADYIETAWIDVAGPFDAYWSARGKNLRQNLRKQRNKLAAKSVRTTLRLLREVQEMKPALVRYGVLESLGWKAGYGTAIHADNVQGCFYVALLEAAARRGEAVVCEYLFDDRTVAMNLCLRRSGTCTVLKTTYDETVELFSPASLLREEELQTFFADGTTRIEYFGRLMEWHSKLTDAKRTLYHMTAYRWPVVKMIARMRRRNATEALLPAAAAGAPDRVPAAPADANA